MAKEAAPAWQTIEELMFAEFSKKHPDTIYVDKDHLHSGSGSGLLNLLQDMSWAKDQSHNHRGYDYSKVSHALLGEGDSIYKVTVPYSKKYGTKAQHDNTVRSAQEDIFQELLDTCEPTRAIAYFALLAAKNNLHKPSINGVRVDSTAYQAMIEILTYYITPLLQPLTLQEQINICGNSWKPSSLANTLAGALTTSGAVQLNQMQRGGKFKPYADHIVTIDLPRAEECISEATVIWGKGNKVGNASLINVREDAPTVEAVVSQFAILIGQQLVDQSTIFIENNTLRNLLHTMQHADVSRGLPAIKGIHTLKTVGVGESTSLVTKQDILDSTMPYFGMDDSGRNTLANLLDQAIDTEKSRKIG